MVTGFVDPNYQTEGEGPDFAQVQPSRSIGGFIAHVTLDERGDDELEISDHPVETGALISDHAYMRPSSVVIRCGWSPSRPSVDGQPTVTPAEMYQNMLELQRSREPFEVITGKRIYQNMLITRLSVVTDPDTENVLLLTVFCREILIVSTQVVSVAAPASAQAEPQTTQPTADQGQKSLGPAPSYSPEAGTPAMVIGLDTSLLPTDYSVDPITGNVLDAQGEVDAALTRELWNVS